MAECPMIRKPNPGTIRKLIEVINQYYEDPEHERQFREWYEKTYGKPYVEERMKF